MKKVIGWIAVSISVFSLAPSVVPGAMSLMGLLASIFALVLSVFSVEKGKRVYFMAIAGCMFWANKLFNRVINT